MTIAEVVLWGTTIGSLQWDEMKNIALFQYDQGFVRSGIEVAPFTLPLSDTIYRFPELSYSSFHGLPGLVSDSLPDAFGNSLIDAWLAAQGRKPASFNPVERLCYIGKRAMGALEFHPIKGPKHTHSSAIDIAFLVDLASEVLTHRKNLSTSFSTPTRKAALKEILKIGTSAGGARAKAVISWNPNTHEVRSGQTELEPGFEAWLIKFDGVSGNKDKELEDPKGYGLIEYAYYLMARKAGIAISDCMLLQEGGRNHFMTKRFDRTKEGNKLHMLSLAALEHFDYNKPGYYAYEQAFATITTLDLDLSTREELFRRMVFNIMARNQDDHVKNISFLMNKQGNWMLAPAYDLTYSYNPSGLWTNAHQMTIQGKRDNITLDDLFNVAHLASIPVKRTKDILHQVDDGVSFWPEAADMANISEKIMRIIAKTHRTSL